MPDGTAMASRNRSRTATEPKFVIGLLAADGSETFTALRRAAGCTRRCRADRSNYGPNVWGNRIYCGGRDQTLRAPAVSTLIDGTDYRVDHDMDTDDVLGRLRVQRIWWQRCL